MSDSHVSNDIKTCLTVFPLLAALILITVFVHQSHLSYNIQLVIELVKACIVISYFVHLIANRNEISNVWWLTIIFVAGLLILPLANGLNRLNGTVDTSKEIQAEKLAEHSSSDAAAGEEGEHVH